MSEMLRQPDGRHVPPRGSYARALSARASMEGTRAGAVLVHESSMHFKDPASHASDALPRGGDRAARAARFESSAVADACPNRAALQGSCVFMAGYAGNFD